MRIVIFFPCQKQRRSWRGTQHATQSPLGGHMSSAVPRAPHPRLTASRRDTAPAWLKGDGNVSLNALKELVKTKTETPFCVAKGPQTQLPQSWLLFGCLWGKKVTLLVS